MTNYTRVTLSAWLTIKSAEPIGMITTNNPNNKLFMKADRDGVIYDS